MPAPSIKLIPLLDAANAHIAVLLGEGKPIHASDHERFTSKTLLPAALTEISDITILDPSGDDGTERLCVTLALSTFVIYTSAGDERENRLAVRALALRIAQSLRYKFKHEGIAQPRIVDIAADYLDTSGDNARGANNASLVECQRIDWEADGYIGADIWENWTAKPFAAELTIAEGVPVFSFAQPAP